jgi:hypothetical protein
MLLTILPISLDKGKFVLYYLANSSRNSSPKGEPIMAPKAFFRQEFIIAVLVLQVFPLILYPPASFSPTSQEWWLPVVLAVLALIGSVQVIRHSTAAWPWYLISFSQGFNIISRLLLVLSRITINIDGVQQFNAPYVIMTLVSMILSAFVIWYIDLPEVRMVMLGGGLQKE